jgi:hypothetical protein
MKVKHLINGALACVLSFSSSLVHAADPLPSWNDTGPKQSIIAFVEKVTKEGSTDFVQVARVELAFGSDLPFS